MQRVKTRNNRVSTFFVFNCSQIALERQRLRRLALCGQNAYPYTYNVTRAFKGNQRDAPLGCASQPGGEAAWRLATGTVKHPPHEHLHRNVEPKPPVRPPGLCTSSEQNCQMPPLMSQRSKSFMTAEEPELLTQANPGSWRTNFYVPFSTLEPRMVGPEYGTIFFFSFLSFIFNVIFVTRCST